MAARDNDNDEFIVFGQPCLGSEEIAAVVEVLESRWIGTGPRCAEFEKAFARLKGVDEALAVSSCTAGLTLALREFGVGPGKEVLTSPVTFAATCNVIEHLGARPVFVDVDPRTGNLDASAVAERVTDATAAILVVHLAGRPVDMAPLLAIREERGIPIVEDCAHAISGEWQGRTLGTIGDAAAFSFYATKNITTGEGGMLLFRDPEKLERARRLSLHGLSAGAWARYRDQRDAFRHFEVVEPGYKFNLTDVQAAIGLAQLEKLERHEERRRELTEYYDSKLADQSIDVPIAPAEGDAHAYHLYSPQVSDDDADRGVDRDALLSGLLRRGVGCGVHYVSLHLHPYYRDRYGITAEDFPAALRFSRRSFSIPLSGCLTDAQAERVTTTVIEELDRLRRGGGE